MDASGLMIRNSRSSRTPACCYYCTPEPSAGLLWPLRAHSLADQTLVPDSFFLFLCPFPFLVCTLCLSDLHLRRSLDQSLHMSKHFLDLNCRVDPSMDRSIARAVPRHSLFILGSTPPRPALPCHREEGRELGCYCARTHVPIKNTSH